MFSFNPYHFARHKHTNPTFLFIIAVLFLLASPIANAQQKATDGTTPLALSPGAPSGSYTLTEFESLNLFNGNLNFSLPLVSVNGRGDAHFQIAMHIDRKWTVNKEQINPPTNTYTPTWVWWSEDGTDPVLSGGKMEMRQGGSRDFVIGSSCGFIHRQTLTRLTFTAPNGTEYELRDQLTHGQPVLATCTGFPRGNVFETSDGSAATFISDTNISDYPFDNPANVPPSGRMLLADGTQYTIVGGKVMSMRDRNGNQLTFAYVGSSYTLSSVTDSLNRQVTFSTVNNTKTVTFNGFGGAARTVKIYYSFLSTVLRSDFTMQTLQQLFPELNGAGGAFDVSVVSAVELPDGRQYQFRYNKYAELARVVLPTGGAIEYDYAQGLTDASESGVLTFAGEKHIYRRVIERRVYPNGGSGASFETKTTYSRPESSTVNAGYVIEEQRDSSNILLKHIEHYFYGSARTSFQKSPTEYPAWKDGKEYRTIEFEQGSPIRQIDKTFDQRQGQSVGWWTGTYDAGPPNDPRVTELTTTLSDTNQVSKQVIGYDDSLPFNNPNNVKEYDFGSGGPGNLLRETRTTFVTSSSYTGTTAHIRRLPASVSVWEGTTERSRTVYEYDSYTQDGSDCAHSFHCPLQPRSDITGLDAAFTTNYLTRGNVTNTTQYLLVNGSVTGSISTYSLYDVAGNLVKSIDPRSTISNIIATTFVFDDRYGAPDGEAQSNSAPALLNGNHSYAFATKTINALGHTTYSQFDFYLGKPVDSEDSNAIVASSYYQDQLDRPTKLINAANQSGPGAVTRQTQIAYDDQYHVITTRKDLSQFLDPNPIKEEVRYDGLGRTTETRKYENNSDYIVVTQVPFVVLQNQGIWRQASKTSNPYRLGDQIFWNTAFVDSMARPIAVATGDTSVVRTAYNGNRALLIDQASKKRIRRTNALDQLTDVWEVSAADGATEAISFPGFVEVTAGYHTIYEYDVLDDLKKITQGSQQRIFTYDSLRRLTSATNPENGSITYQYDENGNIRVKTDALASTHFSYDVLNRVTRRWYNGSNDINSSVHGSPALPSGVALPDEITLYYDSQALPIEPPTFNRGFSTGQLVGQKYGAGTAGDYYGYDALGRRTRKVQRIGSIDYEVTRTFNAANMVTSEKYPSNHTVTYNYDNAGRLADKDTNNPAFSGNLGDGGQRVYSRGIQYAANGQLSQEQFGTAAAIYNKLHYNSRHQLAEILASTSGGDDTWNRGKILNQYSLQCSGFDCNATDNNGNLRKQVVYIPGKDQFTPTTSWYQQYDYDDLNRLKVVHEYTGNTSLDWQQEFVYDRWGNRTIHQTNTSSNIPKPAFGVDPTNNNHLTAPAGFSMSYDAVGNVKTDTLAGSGTRIYDAEKRMTSAGGGSSLYAYDGDGRRVRRTAGGVETWQVYGFDGELVAEYPVNGAATVPAKEYGYRNGKLLISADVGVGSVAPAFADDFNDNLLDSASWSVYYPGLAPNVTEQSQQLQIALTANTAAYNGVYSNSTYNLTNKMVQVESVQAVSQAGWCENFLELELDQNNYFMIQVGAGSMLFRARVNGVNDQTSIPYDGVANRFWRVRHDQSANLINFETSADGNVWLTRKTVTPGFSLTSLKFYLMAGAYGTGNSSPGTAKYDNFKLLTSSAAPGSLTVPNFGFEAPVLGNGNWQYAPSGGSWSFAGGGGISSTNSAFTGVPSAAPEGVQVAFIQGNGTVSQSVSGFQASASYVITVSAIQRTNCCNTGGQDIGVYIDDVQVGSFHPSATAYVEYSTPAFSTSAGTHTVKFAGLNPLGGDHTAFIDKVRITGSPRTGYGVEWLLTDQLGTPRMVFDESGALANVKRHDYLPFGEELFSHGLRSTSGLGYSAADGVRQQFTAKERDTETTLDFFEARYYASSQGRFSSVDPIITTNDRLEDPQRLNLYAYSRNNPLLFTDPTGEAIIIEGGTADQQDAVRAAIATLRAQSPSADAAFKQYDSQTGGPDLNITIMADADFANLPGVTGNQTQAVTSQQGGDEVDTTVKYGASVVIRSSAVNATNETNDRNAKKETMVEGVLSHEVVGHARDITKDQKTWKDQNTQDASMAYQTRRNEVSADRASKRVAVERLIGGYVHFNDFRRDVRFGRKMTP
jgi:RHS repeat-associated protein